MSRTDLRQPTVRKSLFPVDGRDPWTVGLYCDALLRTEVLGGGHVTVNFRVDTGASLTIVPLELAELLGLDVPPPEADEDRSFQSATGRHPIKVRPGRLKVWWTEDRSGHPFDWPVLFWVGVSLESVPPLLGLGGVVSTCRWTFDGTPDPESRFGQLTLEDIR